MITTPQEYYDLLYRIQDENKPTLALLLPSDEKIFEIDLNTRKIDAPKYLSVELDHKAETIYFKIARYYDNIDLANMTCIVQYINAKGECRVYAVPYYDIDTYSDDNMMLFPWCIDGEATKAAGNVSYSVRFYDIDESGTYLRYNISTLPSKSEVLHGIAPKTDIDNSNDYLASFKDQLFAEIKKISEYDLHWEDHF